MDSSKSIQPTNPRHIWRPVKQNQADTHLLGLIATYGATVIVIRTYLELTGYPQVGDSTFHIAHLLWGGLFMFAGMVLMLIWANPWLLPLTAVLGGVGAGLFIDEVGKFITQKNDYFFPLAFPIIYAVTLVGVWLYFRVRRSEPRDARTLLYHALHDIEKILDNDIDHIEYQGLVQTLDQAVDCAEDPSHKDLAQSLLNFVRAKEFEIEQNLHWSERLVMRARAWFAQHPSRRILKALIVVGFLAVTALAALKLYGLFSIALAAQFDIGSVFSNYVIVNGKSRYEVHDPLLLAVHSLFVLIVGVLSLSSVVLLLLGRDRLGLRLGVLGLVLSLTLVNLLTFYFNQLYTMFDALLQFAVLGCAQLYRWRFVLAEKSPPPSTQPTDMNSLAAPRSAGE